jgi:ribosomal protein S18 acetylase RimI-like enzyme
MVVRFGPADVGRRVTLRRQLLDAEPGQPSLGDVVGVLEGWSEGLLRLRKRSGEVVEVAELTVVAGRVVAPEVSADDVQRRADDTWRPRESEPLGEWRLRAHGGVTHRPNSTLAVGDPGMSLPATADAIVAWYSARGLQPSLLTPALSAVAAGYRALGWREDGRSIVMSAALADVTGLTPAAGALRVELTTDLPEDWRQVLSRFRDDSTAELFRQLLTGTPASAFATARDADGRAVAVARGAISDGWVNLTNVEVVEDERGRRLADTVIEAIVGWALEQRATHGFLQTLPSNTSAIRLYERLGFTLHHEYTAFVPPET